MDFPGGSESKASAYKCGGLTWVQSLGQKDLLEKEMATHSSTLAWKIPWTEEPGRLQFMGSQRVGQDWVTSLSLSLCLSLNFLMKLGRNHELVFIPWKRKGIISSWETKILKDRFLWKEDGDMRLFNSDFMKDWTLSFGYCFYQTSLKARLTVLNNKPIS